MKFEFHAETSDGMVSQGAMSDLLDALETASRISEEENQEVVVRITCRDDAMNVVFEQSYSV